jgi:hypothetical protein
VIEPQMEVLSRSNVHDARASLAATAELARAKREELQIMVGGSSVSLIESADAIVEMHETAQQIETLLREIPAPPSPPEPPPADVGAATEAPASGESQRLVHLVLRAVPLIWRALDTGDFRQASALLLQCVAVGGSPAGSRALSDGGFAPYIDHFADRVTHGARCLLRQTRRSTEEHAGALASLVVLGGLRLEDSLACFVQSRTRWIARALRILKESRAEGSATVRVIQRQLCLAVTALKHTIIDASLLFCAAGDSDVDGSGGERNGVPLLLERIRHIVEDASQGIRGAGGSTEATLITQVVLTSEGGFPTATQVSGACTRWLITSARKISAEARAALSGVKSARDLSQIQERLWSLAHFATGSEGDASDTERDAQRWSRACASSLDFDELDRNLVSDSGARGGGRGSSTATRSLKQSAARARQPRALALWEMLFSAPFAEHVELLLRSSLAAIRQDVGEALKSTLHQISSEKKRANAVPPSSEELVAATANVTVLLSRRMGGLAADVAGLVQHGDESAASALRVAVYKQTVEMLAVLVHSLRDDLNQLDTASSQTMSQVQPPSAAAAARLIDGSLLIGRLARAMLEDDGGKLQCVLVVPPSLSHASHDRIGLDQLQAAFDIADTDGDGLVDAEEAQEAIGAVAIGGTEQLTLDNIKNLTFAEFALFATPLLEQQQPLDHWRDALCYIITLSHEAWAAWAVRVPGSTLQTSLGELAMTTDEHARTQHNACWVQKVIRVEGEDGSDIEERIWTPNAISPALAEFLLALGCELNRVLSVVDTIQRDAVTRTGVVSARECLLRHLKRTLLTAYRASTTAQSEAACTQIVVDLMFVTTWFGETPASAKSSQTTLASLLRLFQDRIDPINLQLYHPHFQSAVFACSEQSALFHAQLFGAAPKPSPGNENQGGTDFAGAGTNIITLARPVQRLPLLPLPLDELMPTEQALLHQKDRSAVEDGQQETGNASRAFSLGPLRFAW